MRENTKLSTKLFLEIQTSKLQKQKLWNVKTTVMPVVVDALEIVSEELENHLKTITSCLLKTALLGKNFILWMVFSISESG